MKLFRDFADFITLLQKYEVDYLIVGGYAVGIHSQARMTQDIDFWVRQTSENAEKLIKTLDEFGTPDLNLSVKDILKSDMIIHFGNPPFRIDILTSIDGVEFEEAFKNRFVYDLGAINKVNFISLEDLIKNKRASKRQKDNSDLQWLKDYGKKNKNI